MYVLLIVLCICITLCILYLMSIIADYKTKQLEWNEKAFLEEEKTKRAALEVEKIKQQNERRKLEQKK